MPTSNKTRGLPATFPPIPSIAFRAVSVLLAQSVIYIFSIAALAAPVKAASPKQLETPPEKLEKLIEQSQQQAAEGRRPEALKKLKLVFDEALVAGNRAGAKRLQRAMREIAELFVSEKAQAQFAMAEATWFKKPKEAVDLLQPLASAEPGNMKILILGARAALRTADCSRADSFVQPLLANGLAAEPDVQLLKLQHQDCASGSVLSALPLKLPDTLETAELETPLKLLAIKEAHRRKDLKAARALLSILENQAAENPEVWNWKWKVAADRSAARQYVRLCAQLTPKRREALEAQPDLCMAAENVESLLKSGEKAEHETCSRWFPETNFCCWNHRCGERLDARLWRQRQAATSG